MTKSRNTGLLDPNPAAPVAPPTAPPDDGLYAYRHRTHRPGLSRRVQQDPVGYVEGGVALRVPPTAR
jgi:hypothetical protein